MSKHRVLVIGCGAMGGSLVRGWVNTACNDFDIEIVTPTPRTDFHLLQHQTVSTYEGAPDIIIFAVKPQILDKIIKDYIPMISPDTTIVSVAAGKTIDFFTKHFPKNKIVRAMPNLPVSVNQGVTLLTMAENTDRHSVVETLFSQVGSCFWVPEKSFDSLTALTGSGPAYIYLLTEILGQIIENQGIDKVESIKMAKALVAGSAELMTHSTYKPEELRKAVTSPKGVTAAALNVLIPDMQKLFNKAIGDAAKRSKELST